MQSPQLPVSFFLDCFDNSDCFSITLKLLQYFSRFSGLYKFDGKVIEPVPLNAEDLLRTSFKFADNTVMTGGKESRVYGIEVKTGKIRYECTMAGCFSPTGEDVKIENYL